MDRLNEAFLQKRRMGNGDSLRDRGIGRRLKYNLLLRFCSSSPTLSDAKTVQMVFRRHGGFTVSSTRKYIQDDKTLDVEKGEVKKNGIKDEHSDGEIVPESLFEDGELENNHVDGIFSKKEKEVSEDPFNLYSLLKRQNKLDDKDTNSEDSLKHPPGFTPLTHNCENDTSEKKVDQNDEFSEAGDVDKLKGSANGSISAGHFKVSEIPRTGGSMVGLLEDVIKVGQVMGFKMEGVIANLEELIGTQGGKEGYR
ncbi:hypothetical protein Tco_0005845 [Tanacetum coccineum]